MRAVLVLSALLTTAPLAAHAQLSDGQQRGLIPVNPQDVPLSEAARRASDTEKQTNAMNDFTARQQQLRAAVSSAVPNVNPYASATTTAQTPQTGPTAEDRARDAELAASNARLRAIAAAQRGR